MLTRPGLPPAGLPACPTHRLLPLLQDVDEALKRLPQDVLDARNQRLRRASDLSLKHSELPKELQQLQTPFELYVKDTLDVSGSSSGRDITDSSSSSEAVASSSEAVASSSEAAARRGAPLGLREPRSQALALPRHAEGCKAAAAPACCCYCCAAWSGNSCPALLHTFT